MRQGVLVGLAALAALFTVPSAGAAFEVRLSVNPSVVDAGQPVRIELRAFSTDGGKHVLADDPGRRLRVEAVSPSGRVVRLALRHAARGVWRVTYRFPTAGRWQVRVVNWPNGGLGPKLSVQVRPAGPTPPPAGFGPLGKPGCAPASPRNQFGDDLARAEVFGTAIRARFWGLFAFMPVTDAWASDTAAELQHILGKQTKIVFKLNEFPSAFYAVAPDGTRTAPVWGPSEHESSDWRRSGVEWGAGFVFGQKGCWQIHAASPTVAGDIWLIVH